MNHLKTFLKEYLKTVAHGILSIGLLVGGFALAQTITSSLQLSQDARGNFGVDSAGNLVVQGNRHINAQPSGGPAPTLGTCAGGTLVANSTDFSGSVSGQTGTSCIVNFGQTYGTAPRCVASGSATTATSGPVTVNATTAALTMTLTAGVTTNLNWVCVAVS
jgi:hypothetical protein